MHSVLGDRTEAIPILVNLSTWTGQPQSIPDWLAEELNLKYGLRVNIGKQWLQ
ncbi:MAG: hypothetical protein AB4426_27995 [Xenococcaceae cyanobacterium]